MAASNESALLFDQPGPRMRKRISVINWIAAIVFLAVLVLILVRLYNPPDGENQLSWELWKPALDGEAWSDFYLPGLWATLRATFLAVIGAVVFGLLFGIGRLIPNVVVRNVCAVVIEFCRAVPVLIMMIFFWRAFAFLDLPSPAYWSVVISLVLYNGSVVAELVRSGVGNLPNGQHEAAVALGLTRTQSLMSVEVPQAIYAMLPAAVTQLVVVLKDTALGSIIMYTDLLQESRRLGSMYFDILQTLVVAAVIYFIVCWLLASGRMAAVAHAEAHARPHRGGAGSANRDHGPVERQPDRRGARGTPARWRAAHLPRASPWLERLDPQLAPNPLCAGIRRDPAGKPDPSAPQGNGPHRPGFRALPLPIPAQGKGKRK